MKVATVVGARPQFIKAAAVSRVLRKQHREILIHTGQHYDANMSDVFFRQLPLPTPDFNLEVGSGGHGAQTGEMMRRLEPLLMELSPDVVLVYGDTNSTMAAALTAAKLHQPVAHVEAGLRSFQRAMPEEINRVVTDHVSELLFCPTELSVRQLAREGLADQARLTGDVMLDILRESLPVAREDSTVLEKLGLEPKRFVLATVHRPLNTDDNRHLMSILEALNSSPVPVVIPVHPRTAARLGERELETELASFDQLRFIEPVGYYDMLMLEENAWKIVTDSGGVQKEAYILGTPCITCRAETEWTETVEDGWNLLVDSNASSIRAALTNFNPTSERHQRYGDGHAAEAIVRELETAIP